MLQQFVGREDELAFLNRKYDSQNAEFIVIYGRRRIGKTELIHQFTKDKPHLYYQCERMNSDIVLEEIKTRASAVLEDTTLKKIQISTWYELFTEIVDRFRFSVNFAGEGGKENITQPKKDGGGGAIPGDQKKFIIAIDEFPYLAESEKGIPSIFQKVWDEVLSQSNIMLILCGSSMAMMEREVLSSKSPLFGRRTGQILLRSLDVQNIMGLFPSYSITDVIRVFALCDGIPAYLNKFDPDASFSENVEQIVLNKNEYLYAEGEFLLKSEFREYKNYFLILFALARGKRSFNDITTATHLDKGLVSKYLFHLQSLYIVGIDRPVTTRTSKSRTARYRISDNFLKFWFRFVYANRHEIEEYGSMRFEDIREDFSQYMGRVFEDVCHYTIFRKIGHDYPLVGSWWNRKGVEIDVVALDKRYSRAILGECKWSERKAGVSTFDDLVEKEKILQLDTSLNVVEYYLFSKSGFTEKLTHLAEERKDLTLILADDIPELIG